MTEEEQLVQEWGMAQYNSHLFPSVHTSFHKLYTHSNNKGYLTVESERHKQCMWIIMNVHIIINCSRLWRLSRQWLGECSLPTTGTSTLGHWETATLAFCLVSGTEHAIIHNTVLYVVTQNTPTPIFLNMNCTLVYFLLVSTEGLASNSLYISCIVLPSSQHKIKIFQTALLTS